MALDPATINRLADIRLQAHGLWCDVETLNQAARDVKADVEIGITNGVDLLETIERVRVAVQEATTGFAMIEIEAKEV